MALKEIPTWQKVKDYVDSSGGDGSSPGLMDAAETFEESSVTVSHSSGVNNESLGMPASKAVNDVDDESVSASSANSTSTSSTYTVDVSDGKTYSLEFTQVYWDDCDGWARIYVDGTLEREEYTDVGGESRTEQSISTTVDVSGTDSVDVYYEAEMGGSTYSSFPSVGFDGGNGTWNNELRDLLAASVTVEWPMPAGIESWDVMPFQTTPGNGTVEVYVEDASDGTELAGPLTDPGDISGISTATNVRIRLDLTRESTADNPRLDAVYRRRNV